MSNTITVTGHLGRDAELSYRPDGTAVLGFSVGDDVNRKTASGEWERVSTTWWRVTVWGRDADALAEVLTKGTKVVVTGRASLREYQRQDGGTGQSLDLRADTVGVVPKGEPRQQARDAGVGWDTEAPF